MKRKLMNCLLLLSLVIHGVYLTTNITVKAEQKDETFIVSLIKSTDTDIFIENKGLEKKKSKKVKHTNTFITTLNEDQVQDLKKDEQVAFIEKDSTVQAAVYGGKDPQHQSLGKVKNDQQVIPWGIQEIGTNDELIQNKKAEGKKIKIAVLDTGISPHPDLKISGGISFVDGYPEYVDDNGHGTHIAGTIAALNNKLGVVGVAPESDIYSVKVLDQQGAGTYSQVIQGIDWAIENGMNIISMSFGGSFESQALHEAIKKANDHGILIIASAGNQGDGEETETFPALYPEVISVGAINNSRVRATFSSTGSEIDLVAPGVDILSTYKDGDYAVFSGTSMAVPHVTGAAAALWSQDKSQNSEEIKRKLIETAVALGDYHEYGHGLVNLANALGLEAKNQDNNPNQEVPNDPDKVVTTTPSTIEIIPTTPDTITFFINEKDKELLTLSKQLLLVKKYALDTGNIALAKEIEQKYNDLLIVNTELHELPQELSMFSKEVNISEENQTLSNDGYIFKEKEIDEYYTKKEPDFKKLESTYRALINDYANQLSIKNIEELYQQEDVSSQSTLVLSIDSPIDVDLPSGVSQVYQLTPVKTGMHKIFTGPYGGTGGSNDTVLELYTDAGLTTRIALNDDANGTSFSEIRQTLTAGVTYYVKIRTYSSSGAVHARLTATFDDVPPTDIYLNTPIDVDIPSGGYKVFKFTPTNADFYRIFTDYFGGSSGSGSSDTLIYLYSDANLSKLIAYNDDFNSTSFSQVKRELAAGTSYYIKLVGYSGRSVHARLTVAQETRPFVDIQANTPIDISLPAYEYGYYRFTPLTSGNYRFYTGPYGGTGQSNDTVLYLYRDTNLLHQLAYNDDANSMPFSEIKWEMEAGTTYYFKLGGYAGGSINTRLTAGLLNSSYEYVYDDDNRLISILNNGVVVLNLENDQNGNLIRKRRP